MKFDFTLGLFAGEVLSKWVKTHTQRLWNTISQHGSSLEDMEVVVMLWMWVGTILHAVLWHEFLVCLPCR